MASRSKQLEGGQYADLPIPACDVSGHSGDMDARCQDCPTRRLCLAADLENGAMTALARCVRSSGAMSRGDVLYRAGDAAQSCFIVRSGSYKTFVQSGDGEIHVTGFHFPGDLMGLAGLADGVQRDSAVALETSTACRLPLKEVPRVWRLGSSQALLRLVGRCEQMGDEHQMNLSRPAADARLAGFLVSLGRRMRRQGRSGTCLPLPMSRTDLANHLGMTLESLSRVMARFEKTGLISASRVCVTQERPADIQALAVHLDS